jgi:hypothetical protein
MSLPSRETIDRSRMIVLLALGTVLVLYGLIEANTETLMLGFAILGGEPLARAGAEAPPKEAT